MKISELPSCFRETARENEPLRRWTTMRVGGPARLLIEIDRSENLVRLVRFLNDRAEPWKLLGGGSNVLAADEGYNGVVLVYRSPKDAIRQEGSRLIVSGGVSLHEAAISSVEHGLAGLVFAAWIPGTVGGAVFGNAGAFGEQIGDVLESAVLLTREGFEQTVPGPNLEFGYRTSRLKSTREIVLEATFRLSTGNVENLKARAAEIREFRSARHPDPREIPSAGSFFKNLAPTSQAGRRQAAGAFLDQAGVKNLSVGGASVFEKHANMIVNRNGATRSEILDLSERMKQAVFDRFGISLEREVLLWPEEAS